LVKKFLDKQAADAKEKGYVKTMFGRIRPIPEIKSSNFMTRSFGDRVAMNSPIQGSAADIMKIAMIKCYNELKNSGIDFEWLIMDDGSTDNSGVICQEYANSDSRFHYFEKICLNFLFL